jgi:hypothetical protein
MSSQNCFLGSYIKIDLRILSIEFEKEVNLIILHPWCCKIGKFQDWQGQKQKVIKI